MLDEVMDRLERMLRAPLPEGAADKLVAIKRACDAVDARPWESWTGVELLLLAIALGWFVPEAEPDLPSEDAEIRSDAPDDEREVVVAWKGGKRRGWLMPGNREGKVKVRIEADECEWRWVPPDAVHELTVA